VGAILARFGCISATMSWLPKMSATEREETRARLHEAITNLATRMDPQPAAPPNEPQAPQPAPAVQQAGVVSWVKQRLGVRPATQAAAAAEEAPERPVQPTVVLDQIRSKLKEFRERLDQ
jgi:hypothetical protein